MKSRRIWYLIKYHLICKGKTVDQFKVIFVTKEVFSLYFIFFVAATTSTVGTMVYLLHPLPHLPIMIAETLLFLQRPLIVIQLT